MCGQTIRKDIEKGSEKNKNTTEANGLVNRHFTIESKSSSLMPAYLINETIFLVVASTTSFIMAKKTK